MSIEVSDGEFMVLLGPSGCGKSSVLRMIAGLEPITAGTVSVDGRVINQVPARDRDIAMVFQTYALYPHMDVYNNLAFGLRRRNVPRPEIGPPLEVYRNPVNTFVARFLGNPPMNLAAARLAIGGDAPALRLGGVALPLAFWSGDALARYRDGNILLGIRPEDFYETSPRPG